MKKMTLVVCILTITSVSSTVAGEKSWIEISDAGAFIVLRTDMSDNLRYTCDFSDNMTRYEREMYIRKNEIVAVMADYGFIIIHLKMGSHDMQCYFKISDSLSDVHSAAPYTKKIIDLISK